MIFENIAQIRQCVFGLELDLIGRMGPLALDYVAPAGSADVNIVALLEKIDELINRARGAADGSRLKG